METHQFGPYTIHYMPRSDWDVIGRNNGYYTDPMNYTALVPHHTVTPFVRAYPELVVQKMRLLQNMRPDLGADIPYSFVVFAGKDENEAYVAEGRGLGWTGAHTSGFNSQVHAASFWGNSITDPVEGAVLEAIRFVGRMMPNAYKPTLDHGQYPDQGTSCAGTKLRAALPELQPPFNTPGVIVNPSNPVGKKKNNMYTFRLRPGTFDGAAVHKDTSSYRPAIAFDAAICDVGDEVTVWLRVPSGPRNVTLLESNGHLTTKLVSWGSPVSFVLQNGGWTSIVAGADAEQLLVVEGRG